MTRYAEILFRYWIRFVALLILLPIPVSIAVLIYFRTYQASADLWIADPTYLGSGSTGSNGVAGWNQYLTPAQNQADALNQYLQTTSFLYAVGDQMAIQGQGDPKEIKKIITAMPKNMKVTPNGSHLLTITFSCDKATYCTSAVEATITLFQGRLTQSLKDQEQLSTSFLEGQVTSAKQKANDSEAALEKYLGAHPGLAVPSSQTGNPELDQLVMQAQQDQQALVQLETQLGQAQYTFAAADQFIKTSTEVVDEPGITSAGLQGDGSSVKKAAIVWLAAIGVAGAYLVTLVWLDKTARDTKELGSRLAVPVLATIPMLPMNQAQ
jgi:hypothetical protein